MIMVVEAFTHGVLARQSVNASDNLTKMSNEGPEAQRATGRVANFCSGATKKDGPPQRSVLRMTV